jgi:hypothetical protein
LVVPDCKVLFLLHKKQVFDQQFDVTLLFLETGVLLLDEL